MKTISSRQNPAVRAFRDLAGSADQEGARLLLDGVHLVRDAVAAGLELEQVCVAASRFERDTEERVLALELADRNVEVLVASDAVFQAVSPVRSPTGIAAIARRRIWRAADLCAHPSPLLLVAVDVQDPGNVGAVLRVAEATGVSGAFVTARSANPFSWKALRGSMGSAFRLPVVSGLPADEVFACLRARRVRTIASVARHGDDPEQVRWAGAVALVVGGEGAGLSDAVVKDCDARVTIPMAPAVESLNVAVAAAVLLYAARRHRASPAGVA